MITCQVIFYVFDYSVEQGQFLLCGTVKLLKVLIDHICVDISNSSRQLALALLGFWIIDNYIDRSTLSADTTHLPSWSIYEGGAIWYDWVWCDFHRKSSDTRGYRNSSVLASLYHWNVKSALRTNWVKNEKREHRRRKQHIPKMALPPQNEAEKVKLLVYYT